MKSLLLSILVAVLLCGAAFGSAANFYVTPSGSSVGNCTTGGVPNVAINSLSSSNWGSGSTQIGPDTLVLLCGTLSVTENGTPTYTTGITVYNNGTTGHPITIRFDTSAVLQANAFGGFNCSSTTNCGVPALAAGIFIKGTNCPGGTCSNITIDGQNRAGLIQNLLNGDSSQTCVGGTCSMKQSSIGIYADTCSNIVVQGMRIKNIYFTATGSDMGGAAYWANTIAVQSGCSITATNNEFSDAYNTLYDFDYGSITVVSTNNTMHHMCHMIEAGNGSNTAYGATFSSINDEVYDWSNWGVAGNTGCHTDGLILYQMPGGVVSQFNINGLYAHGDLNVNNSGAATGYIWCNNTAVSTPTVGSGCLITNGIFDSSMVPSSSSFSHIWYNLANTFMYNNTFKGNGANNSTGANAALTAIVLSTDTPAAKVENNLFINFYIDYTNQGYATTWHIPQQFVTSDYNDFYTTVSKFATDQTTNYTTFASWRAATGSPDPHSITTNPLLNAATYQLGTGSPAIGTGTNLYTTCVPCRLDRNGNPRSANLSVAWDMGALTSLPVPAAIGVVQQGSWTIQGSLKKQ